MTREPVPSFDSLKQAIRGLGLRCTAARLAVLQHLMVATGPETHAEVSQALADTGFDRATIYRNLTELTDVGLVSRIELGDHVWRFEVRRVGRDGKRAIDHPHFVCTSCGEVSCLDDVNVAITPKVPERRTEPKGKGTEERAGRTRPADEQAPDAHPRGSGIHSVTDVLLKGRCGNCG
ncbi:MAG: Fur family transcriptional regulator [Pirellulales bacterium]|jgi:Fur family ferric uptake transcriptional regulator